MALLTEKTKKRFERNAKIIAEYTALMENPGAQKYPVYEQLSDTYGPSPTQIGRIVGNIKVTKYEK